MSEETVRKWQELVARRRAYMVELYTSGRWQRHYSEEAFRTLMEDTDAMTESWTQAMKSSANDNAGPASDD